MAYALKMDGDIKRRVYCLTSDGELEEGNSWEAIMFAAKYNLFNLTVLVDRNNIQIDGPTEAVMPLENLRAKWEAFNWHVLEIDGHNIEAIIDAFNYAKTITQQPTVILAHTIPGKGVDYMEYDFRWHGAPPGSQELAGDPSKDQQAKIALHQLRTLGGRIRGEHE
jgi:transketolase